MLLYLPYQYGVLSEEYMFIGNILSLSKWFHKRSSDMKGKMVRAMSALRKEAKKWPKDPDENANNGDNSDDAADEGWLGS